jgi:hypothetical protein
MDSSPFFVTLVGDIFLGSGFDRGEADAIRSFLEKRSLTIANFEGAVPSGVARKKAVNLPMDWRAIDYLPNTVVSLSNNHVLDFGVEGLRATCGVLGKAGVDWFGLESSKRSGDNFRVIEHAGARICLAGFGWHNEECVGATVAHPGVADFTRENIDRMLDKIARERFDFLIVYAHIGYEYECHPLPLHVGLCRYLIDRGAHIVFGSHTHCIQGYEIYGGRYIFYGLGNFCISPGHDRYPQESDRGLAVELMLCKKGAVIEVKRTLSIQYFRDVPGFEISEDKKFLECNRLNISDLEIYGRDYKRIRSRKRNPRPVMLYERALTNKIRFLLWLIAVRLTGYLGVRRLVKKLLGWA